MKLASKQQYTEAMQRMRERIANRLGSASKPPAARPPVASAPMGGGGGGGGAPMQGDRVSTMPVGRPAPFNFGAPQNASDDRMTTMPVGKPVMLNQQKPPSTGGVMPPPPLPSKGTGPVGAVPNTRGPMTPPTGGAAPQMIAKGGKAKEKKYASGGMTASKRADGIAQRGKTKCKMY